MNQDPDQCWTGNTVAAPTGKTCPEGHYCPRGTYQPIECPIGTYLSEANNNAQPVADGYKFPGQEKADCFPCDPGQYCYTRGATGPGLNCEPGYYCESSADEQHAIECPEGAKCPAGSATFDLCPERYYNPNRMQAICQLCPAGYYCPDQGMLEPIICPAGQYCTEGVDTPVDCPRGRFSDMQGLTAVADC